MSSRRRMVVQRARRITALASVFAVLLFVTPVASAQEASRSEERMHVLELEHVVASEVEVLVSKLLAGRRDPYRMVADPRGNRLVLYANEEVSSEIRGMVERLDVPVHGSDGPREAQETAVLRAENRSVQELLPALQQSVSQTGRLAPDFGRNRIVVRDTPARVAELRALMGELDVRARGAMLHFLVLGPGGSPLSAVPGADRVDTELAGLGLEGYGVMGRASVRTTENADFHADGQFDGGEISIRGSMRFGAGERAVEIRSDAKVAIWMQRDQKVAAQRAEARLSSTLFAPLGDLVVVGLTPAGGDAKEPLVLVIRATSSN